MKLAVGDPTKRSRKRKNVDPPGEPQPQKRFSVFGGRRSTPPNVQRAQQTPIIEDPIANEITKYKAACIGLNYENTDCVAWWEKNGEQFPLLRCLYQVYSVIPVSSAATERVFSISGRIGRAIRGALLPEHIALLTKLKHRTLYPLNIRGGEKDSIRFNYIM
eukprot:GHVU01062103.1.p2 GENE.GHVU01062103.1~~GHVU01062103.1.p2  ORF type:complete len:162 (+),score=13.22 GHVU01062103.1:631-1116(+)